MTVEVALALVVSGLAVVAAVAAVRALQRRIRRARAALLRRATDTLDAMGSPGWWAAQRQRRQLWRSVADAERAVTAARRVDAPVGDLPMLCRQLRGTARIVDAQLRVAGRGRDVPDTVMRQAEEVRAAAGHISDAVTVAVTDTVQPQLGHLVVAVRQECAALAAGTRAARRIG